MNGNLRSSSVVLPFGDKHIGEATDWLNSEQEKYLIKELDSSLHTHTQKEEREKTCMSMQMDV